MTSEEGKNVEKKNRLGRGLKVEPRSNMQRKRPDVLPAEEVAVASFLPSFSNI